MKELFNLDNQRDLWLYRFVKSVVIIGCLIVIVAILAACGSIDDGQIKANEHSAHPAVAATPHQAPSSDPATQPPAQPSVDALPIGVPAVFGNDSNATEGSITIDSVHVTQYPADAEFGQRPANGWYVIVHVTAKADPGYTDGYGVNEFDFVALTKGGRQFQVDNGNAFDALSNNQENNDVSGNLGAGQSSSGWMAFDVNRPHGKIAYAPNYDGQPIAEWRY